MSVYYTRSGEPVSFEQWIETFGDDRTVDRTEVGASTVSTVFLGMNH